VRCCGRPVAYDARELPAASVIRRGCRAAPLALGFSRSSRERRRGGIVKFGAARGASSVPPQTVSTPIRYFRITPIGDTIYSRSDAAPAESARGCPGNPSRTNEAHLARRCVND
jgi:hypothetical protein